MKKQVKKPVKKETEKEERKERGKKTGKMHKVMEEFETGKLHSGSKKGPVVKNRRQAIAIGISEMRKAGEKVKPRKKRK